MFSTSELLAEYASLLNKYGEDSEEARSFLDQHRFQSEFFELANLSRKLWQLRVLTTSIYACLNNKKILNYLEGLFSRKIPVRILP